MTSTSASIAEITSIRLERQGFGAAGTVLEMQRSGSASLTQSGNARMGVSEQTSRGTVSPGDFDSLATLIVSRGFFEMADNYAEPGLQDGNWATIAVTRGGRTKQVFSRESAGPQGLKDITTAIDASKARIPLTPHN